MTGFGKRALILFLFAGVFSVPIILFKTLDSERNSTDIQVEADRATADARPAVRAESPPSAAAPTREPAQMPDAPQATAAPIPPPDDAGLASEAPDDFPLEFFGEGDAFPDDAAVEGLLREHIKNNHPALRLSDGQVASLADSMRAFREARAEMQSRERTSANASAIKESLQRTVAAMDEFRRITGMTPGEFFMEGEPPVLFGNTEQSTNDNNEFPTEDWPDPNP